MALVFKPRQAVCCLWDVWYVTVPAPNLLSDPLAAPSVEPAGGQGVQTALSSFICYLTCQRRGLGQKSMGWARTLALVRTRTFKERWSGA